jgi:hypothetical protein
VSTDLEDRLRQMYSAVTDQTVVDDPPPAPLVEQTADHGGRPSRSKVLAIVAGAAMLVVALVYVVGRERNTTPVKPPVTIGPAIGPRIYALPMFLNVPDAFGYDSARIEPLGEIDWLDGFPGVPGVSDDTQVGAVSYSGPNGGVYATVSAPAPDLEPEPGDDTMQLPNGAVAQVTTSGAGAAATITVAWREPGGPLVGVSVPAVDTSTLELLVSNVWIVDRTLWDQATAHAGFLDASANGTAGFDTWTPPGPRIGATIALRGSLQSRLSLATGLSGTMSYGPDVSCWAQQTVDSSDGRRLLLIANGPIDSFTVQPRNGDAVSSTVRCEGATP